MRGIKAAARFKPYKGETTPDYTDFKEDKKYTWVKAPRYNGSPMQVGPLANILVGYASGHALTRKWNQRRIRQDCRSAWA